MHTKPSDLFGLVGRVNPANLNNSNPTTDIVDMSKYHDVMFVLALGAVDSTVDFKLQESNASDFSSGVTDISGKAITQFTGSDDNKQAVINLKASEMSKRYLRGYGTVGNGTTNIACCLVLATPVHGPATDWDLATVSQVIA